MATAQRIISCSGQMVILFNLPLYKVIDTPSAVSSFTLPPGQCSLTHRLNRSRSPRPVYALTYRCKCRRPMLVLPSPRRSQ